MAQVEPPMMEREMITMIVDTLLVFYYEKLVGYMPSSFADLVFTSERIEVGLKRGILTMSPLPAQATEGLGWPGQKEKKGMLMS